MTWVYNKQRDNNNKAKKCVGYVLEVSQPCSITITVLFYGINHLVIKQWPNGVCCPYFSCIGAY